MPGYYQDRRIRELGADKAFHFQCACRLPCFNLCCRSVELPITPWDARNLQKKLGVSDKIFCARYLAFDICGQSGLPLATLKMSRNANGQCPFSSPEGCAVYEARPAACRLFPLGRGSRITKNGIETRYWLVRESFCLGLGRGSLWNPESWQRQEQTKIYNYFNDRFMALATALACHPGLDKEKFGSMARLVLFHQDEFKTYLAEKSQMFSGLAPWQKTDDPTGFDALDLAFDWLELLVFGKKLFSAIKDRKNG